MLSEEVKNNNLLSSLSEADITSVAKVIVSLSVKFCEQFPFLVLDDCIQVSWRELIEYQGYYDSTKSKVTSWVYKLVKDTLVSYAQREYNKTQKWDNIEDFSFLDDHVPSASECCVYSDLVDSLRRAVSPHCFRYLEEVEKNPKISVFGLSQTLGLSERDVIYLRDELKLTTQHILGESR